MLTHSWLIEPTPPHPHTVYLQILISILGQSDYVI